ncbi:hypothetical protein EON65_33185 [archaeon]|nr:MAG: hypothetical protein EON65_33185 [archaeon]
MHLTLSDASGNETVSPHQVLSLLSPQFSLFIDPYNEAPLYFGKRPNDILDIDRMFGSAKFNLDVKGMYGRM